MDSDSDDSDVEGPNDPPQAEREESHSSEETDTASETSELLAAEDRLSEETATASERGGPSETSATASASEDGRRSSEETATASSRRESSETSATASASEDGRRSSEETATASERGEPSETSATASASEDGRRSSEETATASSRRESSETSATASEDGRRSSEETATVSERDEPSETSATASASEDGRRSSEETVTAESSGTSTATASEIGDESSGESPIRLPVKGTSMSTLAQPPPTTYARLQAERAKLKAELAEIQKASRQGDPPARDAPTSTPSGEAGSSRADPPARGALSKSPGKAEPPKKAPAAKATTPAEPGPPTGASKVTSSKKVSAPTAKTPEKADPSKRAPTSKVPTLKKVSTSTVTTPEKAGPSKTTPVSKVTTPKKGETPTATTPQKVNPSKAAPVSKVPTAKKVPAATTTTPGKTDTSKTSPEKVPTSGATAARESVSPKKPVSPVKKATSGGDDLAKRLTKLEITARQTGYSLAGTSGARDTEEGGSSQEASIAGPSMAPPPSPASRDTSATARVRRKPSPEKPDSAVTKALDEGLSKLSLEGVSKEASPMVTARPPVLDSSAESSTEPESGRRKTSTKRTKQRTTGSLRVGAARRGVDARIAAFQQEGAPEEVRALRPRARGAAASSEAAPPPMREEFSEEAGPSQRPSVLSRLTASGSDLPATHEVRIVNIRSTAPATNIMSIERKIEKKVIWKPNVSKVPFITTRKTYGLKTRDPLTMKYELCLADAPEAPFPEIPEKDTSISYYKLLRAFKEYPSLPDRRQRLSVLAMGIYKKWLPHLTQEPMNTIAKVDEFADRILAVGQTKYTDEEFLEAVNYFTTCIAYAPNQSPSMMTALLLRAKALYRLKKYDDALATIQYALDTGNYLDEGRGELDELKRMCEAGKRAPPPDSPKKKETKEEARARKTKAAKEAKATKGGKGAKAGKGAAKPAKAAQTPKKEDDPMPWKEPNFQNPDIPNATSKVKFVYDRNHGRCLEATEDIEAGEPIIFHGYTFTVLDEAQVYLRCAYCLKRSYSMIPCPGCVENMYCSAACLQKAYDEYHRIECKVWTPFRTNKEPKPASQELMMLIRMMLVRTKQGSEWRELINRIGEPKDIFSSAIPDDVGDAPIDDYKNLLRWRRVNDWVGMLADAGMASEVVSRLKLAGFFQEESHTVSTHPDATVSLAELMAVLVFLNHSVTMSRQRFSVDEYEGVPPKVSDVVGYIVTPLTTVMQHSCFCNVLFIMKDRDFVAFAIRPIKRGERIMMGYMSAVPNEPIKQRRHYLLHSFGIICRCTACIKNMPLLTDNERTIPQYANDETIKKSRTALIGIGRPAADEIYFKKMSYKEIMRMVNKVFKWMEEHLNAPYYYETHLLMQATYMLLCIQYDDYHKGIADKDSAKTFVRERIALIMTRAGIDVRSIPRMN